MESFNSFKSYSNRVNNYLEMENILRIILIEKLRENVLHLERVLQTFDDQFGDIKEVRIQIMVLQREINELLDDCNNHAHNASLKIISDTNLHNWKRQTNNATTHKLQGKKKDF